MRAAAEPSPDVWGTGRAWGGGLGRGEGGWAVDSHLGHCAASLQKEAAGITNWSQNREQWLVQGPPTLPQLVQGTSHPPPASAGPPTLPQLVQANRLPPTLLASQLPGGT